MRPGLASKWITINNDQYFLLHGGAEAQMMMRWWNGENTKCIRFNSVCCWLRFKPERSRETKLISSWLALFLFGALNSSGAVQQTCSGCVHYKKFERSAGDWLLTWPLHDVTCARGLRFASSFLWFHFRTVKKEFLFVPRQDCFYLQAFMYRRLSCVCIVGSLNTSPEQSNQKK